eukprot:14318208-Heterocapsa_arctica.AAC.1
MIKAAPQGGVAADHKRKREEDEAAKARSQLEMWNPNTGRDSKGHQWSDSGKSSQHQWPLTRQEWQQAQQPWTQQQPQTKAGWQAPEQWNQNPSTPQGQGYGQ